MTNGADMINTTDISSARVLAALYNRAKPQGLGMLHFTPADMTEDEAGELLATCTYFDYLQGRVMKVDLSEPDGFDPRGYDRDNGDGAAKQAIDTIRDGGEVKTSPFAAIEGIGSFAKVSGTVPSKCTLPEPIVGGLLARGEDPCAGCNMDRGECDGRPRGQR